MPTTPVAERANEVERQVSDTSSSPYRPVTVLWMNCPRRPLRVLERSLITVVSSSTDFKQIYTSQRQLPTDQCESQVSLRDQLQRL